MPNPESRGMEEVVKPEQLVPTHISGESGELEAETKTKKKRGVEESVSPQELYKKRSEILSQAPDLERSLSKHLREKGKEVPENVNLSLVAIEEFQRLCREAQDLRKLIRHTKDPKEKRIALGMYANIKSEIEEYLQLGPTFEAGYREYIRNRNEYVRFKSSLRAVREMSEILTEPAFTELDDQAGLDERALGRIEGLVRQTSSVQIEQQDRESVLEALSSIYPEGSEEYKQMTAEMKLEFSEAERPRTKKDIANEIKTRKEEIEQLWANPMVRYFANAAELEKMMEDYHKGEAVLETQSVIGYLNKLHEWEQLHQRTTIGGVLVGPPGVGKTTLVRHYLESKGRRYVYMDLSEDVTRFMLYGSKSIEFKSPVEYYERLTRDLKGLDDARFRKFIETNAKQIKDVFGVTEDQAAVILVEQIQEELKRAGEEKSLPKEMASELAALRGKINTMAENAHLRELATEFGHIVKRNGWRDGVIISALRRGDSVIMDEFNKNKNWSLLYGLMTAEPGKKWYFADNDEHIQIPDDWRMYLTANIGTRHGVFAVAEALASRAGGRVMEVGYPSSREELLVALTALSNPEGDFLRSDEDLAKLFVLIHEVFPRMRKYLEDKKQTIPVSYRTIRDVAEKLVLNRDPKSKQLVYQPSNKSFDEALYEVLIDSYSLYEDKEQPKKWVEALTSLGLLLDDDKVKERVIGWIGEADYEERSEKFKEMKEDFQQVVSKIKGAIRGMGADMAIPDQINYK
jgi:MoxR-like ATPase